MAKKKKKRTSEAPKPAPAPQAKPEELQIEPEAEAEQSEVLPTKDAQTAPIAANPTPDSLSDANGMEAEQSDGDGDNEDAKIKESFLQSIASASAKELAGKRRRSVPFDRILSKILWSAVVCALVGIIVWQGAEVVAAKIEYQRGNEFYTELANKLSLSSGEESLVSSLYGEKTVSALPDYEDMQNGAVIIDKQTLTSAEKKELAVYNAKLAVLKKQNPDTVGWIYIPGTNIDYPVVLAPAKDPEYYMDHSFSGANYSLGAIYIESRCYGSILKNKNTIIVGHNIRLQGMMFNQLVKFGEEDFFKDHSEIYIYTEEGKFVFNLFSFYRVDQNYNFRRVSFLDNLDYLQYLESMRKNSWYQREGISFDADDRIITMYTCTNDNIKTNRYVAVAVLQDCLLNE